MDRDWLLLTIAVTAVAWIVIRRWLKKKEVEETPTEEVKAEDVAEGTEKTGKE